MPAIVRPAGELSTLARDVTTLRASTVPPPVFAWKTRIVVPGMILLALLLLIGYSARDALLPATAVRVVPVVVKVSNDAAAASTMSVQAPGWVEADPYPISVSALADGIIKDVLALEGQTIRAGDVVARMVDDDAKLGLASAEATLLEAQASLRAARQNWDNPIERTRSVAAGKAMVAETKADLEKLKADIAVESAKLVAARIEAERIAQAFETRASSEVETVRAQQAYEAQKALLESTKAQQPVLQAKLAQREADLVAANENLRLRIDESKALAETEARVALATAQRDEAALRLSRMEVRSSADGVVMQRLAAPGDKLVMAMDAEHSAHVVRLYDPNKLQVRVDIPIADAAKVGVGQPAKIVVAVTPDRTFDGVVTRVVNEADIQKNTLQVKVAITNPSPELKPEMLARVRITAANGSGRATMATTRPGSAGAGGALAVFAPIELLHREGATANVWVVDPRHNVAVHKSIALGELQQDGWVVVASGLSPGDQLIAADRGSLRDGQRIRVVGEASLANVKQTEAPHGTH